jgi:hypothetical protein
MKSLFTVLSGLVVFCLMVSCSGDPEAWQALTGYQNLKWGDPMPPSYIIKETLQTTGSTLTVCARTGKEAKYGGVKYKELLLNFQDNQLVSYTYWKDLDDKSFGRTLKVLKRRYGDPDSFEPGDMAYWGDDLSTIILLNDVDDNKVMVQFWDTDAYWQMMR